MSNGVGAKYLKYASTYKPLPGEDPNPKLAATPNVTPDEMLAFNEKLQDHLYKNIKSKSPIFQSEEGDLYARKLAIQSAEKFSFYGPSALFGKVGSTKKEGTVLRPIFHSVQIPTEVIAGTPENANLKARVKAIQTGDVSSLMTLLGQTLKKNSKPKKQPQDISTAELLTGVE